MPWDVTVILEDRPGTFAALGEAMGEAGINIDGVCGFPCEGRGVIHVLVEDGAAARRTLDEAGIEVGDEREVLVLDYEDRPGEFGRIARRMANAGVNIDLIYVAGNTRLVLGVDDLGAARGAV
ncbi:MAG: amino acid-binding protein [Acidimicrobiia bacterium]